MSAIFGLIRPDGAHVEAMDLDPMAEAMSWRGPQGRSGWRGPGAALGALQPDPEPRSSAQRPPLLDERAGAVVLAHARLDDRQGLGRALGLTPAAADGAADVALIRRAWERWGEDCPRHLFGDFAIAVWQVEQRRLFLARDHMGLKPLYLYHDGRILAFASSARAVARAPGVDAGVDPARVADYLTGLEGVDHEGTFFRNIRRLPPAHSAVFEDGRLTRGRYWRPAAAAVLRLGSDAAYLEAFGEVFERAVGDRLAGKAACMLSGGVDSSAVVGVARDLLADRGRGPLATFSAISGGPEPSAESSAIARVIGHGGLNAVCLGPEAGDLVGHGLDEVFGRAEEPWETMHLIAGLLFRRARSDGHRAVLAGVDGDLVLALPESYPALLAAGGHWVAGWREARGQAKNYFQTEPSLFSFLRRAAGASMAPGVRRVRRRLALNGGTGRAADPVLSPEVAAAVDLAGRVEAEDRASSAPAGATLAEHCASRMTAPYLTAAVERYERLAAVCGLESRQPLLDRRVIEFSLALPWQQKARNGWSKYILRRLVAERLPPEVAWRRDFEHLSTAFRQARFRAHRDRFRAELARQRERLAQWVQPERFRALVRDLETAPESDMETARKLIELGRWLERNGG